MKGLKLIIGLCILVMLIGCKSRIEKYECKMGEKSYSGDVCYTNLTRTNFSGCGTLYEKHIKDLNTFIYDVNPNDVAHLTESHCLYEEIEIRSVKVLDINDSTIEVDIRSGGIIVLINDGDRKDICINVTYDYRWKRIIWDVDNNAYQPCIDEVREFNGEILERPSFLLDFTS